LWRSGRPFRPYAALREIDRNAHERDVNHDPAPTRQVLPLTWHGCDCISSGRYLYNLATEAPTPTSAALVEGHRLVVSPLKDPARVAPSTAGQARKR
jgi:hypothetical protein